MGLGAFTKAEWGAVDVDAAAPSGVEPPGVSAGPLEAAPPTSSAESGHPYRIGIDAGSKTIKVAILDSKGATVYSAYHRHRSDILTTLADLAHEMFWKHGDIEGPVSITGSAGIGIAEALGIPFVQEVLATTRAVQVRHPEADCIIELGGEDAKIIYLTGGLEQRMNATCAGGTGDFIDGIAGMLNVRTRDFSKLAFGAQRTYPIASRCAVFAQSDVRPLMNAGAAPADIALSVLKAVVKQTLGGLACGRPITGTVVFLGGPLNYIPALEREFRLALGLTRQTGIRPRDAHLYTAAGAAMAAEDAPVMSLSELERRVRSCEELIDDLGHLPPLFADDAEREAFRARHDEARLRPATEGAEEVFLGFDAGSTSMKYAIVDASGGLVASRYELVEGDVLKTAKMLLESALESVASVRGYGLDRRIVHATVTGYGEDLLRAAFGFDSGVVETVAHLQAARAYRPDVSFVLDIGGQDMKALWVRDGMVVDAVLNEACSSGCGAFVQSNVRALQMSHERFSNAALTAENPIDLGTKCTVFMTSRVRHAQKIGAPRGDIAAGVAYSVVNNALMRIIGPDRVASMGDAVVVQGGTFKSDAVLRAFEKVTGVEAIRPVEAHLMGAYGAALVARDRYLSGCGDGGGGARLQLLGGTAANQPAIACPPAQAADTPSASPASCGTIAAGDEGATSGWGGEDSDALRAGYDGGQESSLVSLEALRAFDPKRTAVRCEGCGNACLLSVVEFGDGRRFVSGNKCDRAHEVMFGEKLAPACEAPNVVAVEQGVIAKFGDIASEHARGRVTIGLPKALNAYENTSFWHSLFASLGFSIVVADDDAAAPLASQAAATIPSESVCYPAKRVHLRYAYLVQKGADYVFLPRSERGMRCPVATGYADALRDNVGDDKLLSPLLRSIGPRGLWKRPHDREVLYEAIAALAPEDAPIPPNEFQWALERAFAKQGECDAYIAEATRRALWWIADDPSRRGVVMVGRPYHSDPALSHGIDRELNRLGFAVISPAGLAPLLLSRDEGAIRWMASRHLVQSLEFAAGNPQLEVVAIRSFGCGFDAVALDEATDVSRRLHKPFTALKVDDIADVGHIRIRLRTLAEMSALAHESEHESENGSPTHFAETLPGGVGHLQNESENRSPTHARGSVTPDLCSTAKALCERTLAALEGREPPYTLEVPVICRECLTDALPFELAHVTGYAPTVASETVAGEVLLDGAARGRMVRGATQADLFPRPFVAPDIISKDARGMAEDELAFTGDKPVVGLVGNPLLVFDERMNDGVVALLERLGCEVALPNRRWLEVDDVRYLWQLEAFCKAGVDHVIYLQSFGCLKGHVQSRGALHGLARRFPGMPITVIDYDREASALNRENRVRLAAEAAREAHRGMCQANR